MIVDLLDQADWYRLDPWWRRALEFARAASPDLADGELAIEGRRLFARVLTYRTVAEAQAVLEAHRRYVDIQVVLSGAERVAVWPVPGLEEQSAYDPERDVTLYRVPRTPPTELHLRPGAFAVFFPHDAHMPQLSSGAEAAVKKLVIKAAVDLLGSPSPAPAPSVEDA